MFDLTKATKTQLVTLYRSGLENMDQVIPAFSTASKMRNADLVKWIEGYVANGNWSISDEGEYVEIQDADEAKNNADKASQEITEEVQTDDEDHSLDIVKELLDEPEATDEVEIDEGKEKATRSHNKDEDVITIIVDKIPGRDGSASYERRKLMRSGMTVGEFVKKVGKKGRSSLAKSVRKGWIKITSA